MSPIFKRPAISFRAPATSSAWARLSSWHGPAMIEIGKSLPNLTWPAVTTGAAEMLAFKALSFFGAAIGIRADGDWEIFLRQTGYHFVEPCSRCLDLIRCLDSIA